MVQLLEQRFPASRGEDSGEAGCPVSMQPMEAHGGDECPKQVVTLLDAQAAAGFWQGNINFDISFRFLIP